MVAINMMCESTVARSGAVPQKGRKRLKATKRRDAYRAFWGTGWVQKFSSGQKSKKG